MAQEQVTARMLVTIGGSAGSLDVIIRILPALNNQAGYAVIIVIHRRANQDSLLSDILAMKTNWPVIEAEEKIAIRSGHVYIVPADYHLLVEKDHTLSLDSSEKINFSRPSIDVSFESAAEVYRDRCVAVLLSGANADGVEGLRRVKELGGTCIVQDPSTADVPYMPQQAIAHATVDFIVPADKLGEKIDEVCGGR